MWYRTQSLQRRLSVGDHLHLPLASSLHWAPWRHFYRLASQSSSDLHIGRRNCCRYGRVHTSTFDVANRRSMEGCGEWGAICVAIWALWLCSVSLVSTFILYSTWRIFSWLRRVTWRENPSLIAKVTNSVLDELASPSLRLALNWDLSQEQ